MGTRSPQDLSIIMLALLKICNTSFCENIPHYKSGGMYLRIERLGNVSRISNQSSYKRLQLLKRVKQDICQENQVGKLFRKRR